jgi:diketogulonate reductase-like aldo/keto reductase
MQRHQGALPPATLLLGLCVYACGVAALPMPKLALGAGDRGCGGAGLPACQAAITTALKLGFRHIDAAYEYGTQAQVGGGFRDSGLPRDEVFITTKIPGPVGYTEAYKYFEEDLQQLGKRAPFCLCTHTHSPVFQAWTT